MQVLILDKHDHDQIKELIAILYGRSDRERDVAHRLDLLIKRGIEANLNTQTNMIEES